MKRILCGIIISNLFPFSCAHAHNHSTVLTNQQAPQHLLQKKKNKAPKSRANATENFILPASNHLAVTHDISERNITPRKVMLVFHNKEGGDKYGEDSATFRYFGMPLEYLGYVPVLTNISKKMSTAEKNQPLAGIIVLADAMPKDYSRQFLSWLAQEKKQGVPILFFNGFPFIKTSHYLKTFGLTTTKNISITSQLRLSRTQKHLNFETTPSKEIIIPDIISSHPKDTWLSLTSSHRKVIPLIATTQWGGYVSSDYGYWSSNSGAFKWIVNPFATLRHMLHLQAIPVPETTTENGTRLMMTHIDGDGFVNRAQFNHKKFDAKVIDEEILKHFKIPTTVSIVEGEICPSGLYPSLSKEAEVVARGIFKPKYIELASHSFSHPFDWRMLEGTGKVSLHSTYNLPIKKYKFNLERDISGSVNYINNTLAPAGKKVTVFLWTGNADPSEKAVKLTYSLGLMNMNGGVTNISKKNTSLVHVYPMGIYKGGYYQIYAPIGNEISYTNNWQGPYYGFKNVIQTLKMTDTPRRIKPIDVYYHFYSGDKRASINALKTIFNWTKTQDLMHIFVSSYAKKVLDFNQALFQKIHDGWRIFTNGHIRELRIPISAGYPDLTLSQNIIGYSRFQNVRYIHLGTAHKTKMVFTKHKTSLPYLVKSNVRVTQWNESKNHKIITAAFKGFDQLKVQINNVSHCLIHLDKQTLTNENDADMTLSSKNTGEHKLKITCK